MHDFIHSDNCMVSDILEYQGQHETENLQALHGMRAKTEEQQMIMNESGIHTFSLKLQCKYSEIQNIIEQNECIRTSKRKIMAFVVLPDAAVQGYRR